MTLVRASDVTIHTVGFLEHQASSARLTQRMRLQEIAEATGGQAFFPSAMKDVEAAYDKIVAQIRAQYTLGYTSTNTAQDGKWRRVEVKVVRPDLGTPASRPAGVTSRSTRKRSEQFMISD